MRTISAQAESGWRQRVQTILGRHGLFWLGAGTATIVVVAFVWLLFQPSGKPGSVGILSVGQTAPNFSMPDTVGHPISLAQLRGHPVILNFWATVCLPCRSETPLLQRTYLAHQAQGLTVLGIDQAEPVDSVVQYGKDYALTYPLVPDVKLAINHQDGVTGLPVSYFIDAQGVIRYAVNGVLTANSLATGLHTIGINT